MTKFLSFFLTVTITLLSVSNILADQITLKNGDRLSGKIIKQDDEKIILQTEFTGGVTISKTNIQKIIADANYVEETETSKEETTVAEKTEEKTLNDAVSADNKKDDTLRKQQMLPEIQRFRRHGKFLVLPRVGTEQQT